MSFDANITTYFKISMYCICLLTAVNFFTSISLVTLQLESKCDSVSEAMISSPQLMFKKTNYKTK